MKLVHFTRVFCGLAIGICLFNFLADRQAARYSVPAPTVIGAKRDRAVDFHDALTPRTQSAGGVPAGLGGKTNASTSEFFIGMRAGEPRYGDPTNTVLLMDIDSRPITWDDLAHSVNFKNAILKIIDGGNKDLSNVFIGDPSRSTFSGRPIPEQLGITNARPIHFETISIGFEAGRLEPVDTYHAIAIGRFAKAYGSNIIAIGNNAVSTNDHEIVVTFTDGTEWRRQLPNKNIDLADIFSNAPATTRGNSTFLGGVLITNKDGVFWGPTGGKATIPIDTNALIK